MANRIRPGERLPGIHAASWNEFADTADFVEGLQNPVGGALNAKPIKGTITIPAKLHAALPSFSVVKLSRADQELTNVELGAAPVFDTGAPAEDGAFGITQRHGAATEQVEVVISGYVQAQVDIQSADDETCGVIDNDTDKLESGKGSTPIIWKPSGTGVKWCIVQLGGGSGKATAAGAWAKILVDVPAATISAATAASPVGTSVVSGGEVADAALILDQDGNTVADPSDPSSSWVLTARNAAQTIYHANDVVIPGMIVGEEGSEKFVIAWPDFRGGPGHIDGQKQAWFHRDGSPDYELGGEDC